MATVAADIRPMRPQRRARFVLLIVLLAVGYSGYYLGRSNLSVCMPMIVRELAQRGMDPDDAKVGLGMIASLGTLGYAVGKFLSGTTADFLGGRRTFLAGMAGAVLFTIGFTITGMIPIFAIAWLGNRLLQSLGWVGMVKIVSRWSAPERYGTVMAVLSLSFLFGDAAARYFMGVLIAAGMDWRGIFLTGAAMLSAWFVLCWFLIRESPTDLGMAEPADAPANVYGADSDERPAGVFALLRPLLVRPAFWVACLLCLGFTLLRETFTTWTATYFVEGVRLSESAAARWSAIFPLLGGVSVIAAGLAGDRLGRHGRAAITLVGLVFTTVALAFLAGTSAGTNPIVPVGLVALVALSMTGPYSYLAGAVSLDFGGKRGAATACGWIDGVGYLGGVLAGGAMAKLSVRFGWTGAFVALACVAGVSSAVAVVAWRMVPRSTKEYPV